ncbi:ribonuclease P protein component [Candidatus Saccharibacteria bacterium]|nr:ribonuclease P protein component [Candidatus Saccharibacteria bacterium]
MLTKTHRFHGHNSLNYVYRHGQTVRGPLTALKYASNSRRQTYRVAVVVSKKVHKSAVVRNRIRRRIYEQIRLMSDEIQQPYDIVITVFHENIAELAIDELAKLLHAQLHQARIL